LWVCIGCAYGEKAGYGCDGYACGSIVGYCCAGGPRGGYGCGISEYAKTISSFQYDTKI